MRSVVAFKDGTEITRDWDDSTGCAHVLWAAVSEAEGERGGEPHNGTWVYLGSGHCHAREGQTRG